ncbi:MAG: hypothetical protein ABJ275_06865 [Maricaulaceae bacterium]
MLKKLSLFTLTSLSLFSYGMAYSSAKLCDITYQDDITLPSTGETVTLKYIVEKNEQNIINHNVYMVFHDGYELSLPMGTMCLDQALGCQDIALRLHESLKRSLSGKAHYAGHEISTMGDFATLIADDAFCAQPLLPYVEESFASQDGDAQLTKVKNSNIWQSDFLHCNPILENLTFTNGEANGFTKSQFWRLVEQDAPIFSIPYANGETYYAYDAQTRELKLIETQGC